MQDGNEAAKELERCMTKLGFKGVEMLTNVNGKELSDPAFAPFWKKAEELGALVVIHPNGFTQPQRLSRFYFNNVIGNPLETTIALHYLIFDGVLERHPNSEDPGRARRRLSRRLFRPHRSCLGRALGCARRSAEAADDAISKKVYFDTRRVHAATSLKALVKTYGADHIVMGTDYPFDMLEYDPIGHVASVESFDEHHPRRARRRQREEDAGDVISPPLRSSATKNPAPPSRQSPRHRCCAAPARACSSLVRVACR